MKSKERNILEELELGLGGGKKFRILVHLILNPNKTFTKYYLAKATGLRTPSVGKYLRTLVDLGWVKENKFKPKTYQINLEDETVKSLYSTFQKIWRLRDYPLPPLSDFSQTP